MGIARVREEGREREGERGRERGGDGGRVGEREMRRRTRNTHYSQL